MATTHAHPFERVLAALAALDCSIRMQGEDRARAQCPTHRDARPSLYVTRTTNSVLIHCHAGCKKGHPLRALGMRKADLFVKGGPRQGKRKIVATYAYRDASGVLVAEKVRRQPKDFRWRRPDPANPERWLPGLAGLKMGLYGLDKVNGCERVFCVEGEKDVDRLWASALPAVCSPVGVAPWKSEWSEALRASGCRELVIIPDADRPGREHAERVAEGWWELTKDSPHSGVKVVALSGLFWGADVSDWFDRGHSVAELQQEVHQALWWAPGARERARTERRRAKGRERVRKHRAKKKEEQARAWLAVCSRLHAVVPKGRKDVTL